MNWPCHFLQKFIFCVYIVLSRVVPYSLIEEVSYRKCTHKILLPPTSVGLAGLQVWASDSKILAETLFYKSMAKQVLFYCHRKGAQLPFHHPVFAT